MNLIQLFFLIVAAIALFALYLFWTEPLFFLSALERLTPNIVYRVRTRLPLVALSFDDGPHPTFTPQVLDILQRHDAKATFFLIGDSAMCHPDVLASIRIAGHEVGNHYSANVPTLFHSDATFVRNLEQTEVELGLPAKPEENGEKKTFEVSCPRVSSLKSLNAKRSAGEVLPSSALGAWNRSCLKLNIPCLCVPRRIKVLTALKLGERCGCDSRCRSPIAVLLSDHQLP